MTQNINPNDTNHTLLTLPVNGEPATIDSILTAFQHLLDLTEVMRQSLLHIATANSVAPGSRGTADGIKRIRQFTSTANLKAFAQDATNDREWAAVVGSDGINLVYVYDHTNATAEFPPFTLKPGNEIGLWVLLNYNLFESNPGVPWVDANGRLQNTDIVPGSIAKIQTLSSDGEGEDFTSEGGVTHAETTYQDPGAGSIFTITGIQTGDIVDVELSFHGRIEQAADESVRVIVALHIGQGGSFAKHGTTVFIPVIGGDAIADANFPAHLTDDGSDDVDVYVYPMEQRTIRGRYVATSNDNVVVKPMLKSNGVNPTSFFMYTPVKGTARVLRP